MAKKVTAETRAAAFEAIRYEAELLDVVKKFGIPAAMVLELAALNAKGSKPRSEGGGR